MTDRPQRSHIDIVERFAEHDRRHWRIGNGALAFRKRRPSARSCSRPKNAVRSDSDADRSDYHRPESDRGHVRSDWAILDDPTGAKLRICWEERGGPRVQPTDREGFVSRLIEASLEKAEAVLATEGASCVLEMTL